MNGAFGSNISRLHQVLEEARALIEEGQWQGSVTAFVDRGGAWDDSVARQKAINRIRAHILSRLVKFLEQ